MDESTLKAQLMEKDNEFRELVEKHQRYDEQLEELIHKSFPDSEDQLQETIIKKKKLAVKDQIFLRMSQFQSEHASASS